PDDDVDGRVATLFRLATAAWWPGDVRGAETFVRQALELAEQHGRRDLRGRALRTLEWLLKMQLELDEAAELLDALDPPGEDALGEAERLAISARRHVSNQDLTSTVSTLRTLGLVRAAQGRDDEAESLLRESLELVEQTDAKLLEVGVIVPLARHLRLHGREAEAEVLEARLPARPPGWLNDVDRIVPAALAAGQLRS